MKKILLPIVFISSLSFLTNAQQFDWVVAPTFKGYDEVKIGHESLKFIVVKKDGKYGVVSSKNEMIVPAEYKSINQITEDHFSASHDKNSRGKVNTFFDGDGYALDFDKDIQAKSTAKKIKEQNAKAAKVEAWLSKNCPGAKMEKGSFDNQTNVILSNGDTLLKNSYFKQSYIVGDKYIIARKPDRDDFYYMKDKDGKVYLKDKRVEVKETDEGYTLVGYKLLVDKTGKIHFEGSKSVGKIRNTEFYKVEQESEKVMAYDSELNPIFPQPYKFVRHKAVKGVEYLFGLSDSETAIYNASTKKTTKFPHVTKEIYRGPAHVRTYQVGELTGTYNILTGETIEPKYKHLTHLGDGFFLGANDKYSRKKKNSKTFERNILNDKGEVVYSSINRGISHVGKNYFNVLTSDTTSVLLDDEMNEKLSLHKKDKITYSGGWIMEKEGKKTAVYPIERYLSGDKSIVFDWRPKKIEGKKGFSSFFQAKKNDKIGFCDDEGNLLHPCELEEIGEMKIGYGKDPKGYFMAKKNGKWGILQWPSN